MSLPSIHHVPRAVVGLAADLEGLAYVGVFQLAVRFDGPAGTVFGVAERVDAGARAVVEVAQRVLETNTLQKTVLRKLQPTDGTA